MAIETTPPPADVKPTAAPDASPPAAASGVTDSDFKSLLANLAEDNVENPPTQEQKDKAAEERKKKELEAAPPKPGEPDPKKVAEKPITARVPKLKRPDVPVDQPARREEPAPAPARAGETVPDDSDLIEEEKQMIADAEEAEKLLPAKHAGLAAKVRKFVKANQEFINKHGGDESFDDESPEYQRFLAANRPVLTAADSREITETRITNRVTAENRSELDKVKDQRFADREEPQIETVARTTYNRLASQVTPKEIHDAITEALPQFGGDRNKAYESVKGYYKVELAVVADVLKEVQDDQREFERIMRTNPETGRPLVAVATDPRDPKFAHHTKLANIVRNVCTDFLKNAPQAEQVRDGKWFATKDEYLKMSPAQRASWWTFSNREAFDRGLRSVPAYVQQRIARRLKELSDDGFTRPPRVAKKPEAPPAPVRGAPPAPHPSAVPSGGSSGEPKTEGAKLNAILQASG